MEDYGPSTYGDRIAEVYDDFYQARLDPTAAVDLLADLAGDGRALELGIGTGRVAIPLAAKGVKVEGIDASEAMVAGLRAKPGGADIPVTMGDFTDLPIEGTYRLIYVPFTTLFALPSQADQLRCLRAVAAHLDPQGWFVMEAFVPDLGRYRNHQSVTVPELTTTRVMLDTSRHDPVTQTISSAHVVLENGGVRIYPVFIRYAWPAELDAMSIAAGLEPTARYGDYDKSTFDASSTRHVSVYRKPDVRIAVLGAGAVGGVVGARLHQAGHDVVLIARGANFDAINERGLKVRSPEGDVTIRIPVVDHPSGTTVGPNDALVLAVKSHQTAAALDALDTTAPGIVCLQNGVANERAALRRFPEVYGVAVMCPTAHLEPGVVQVFSTPVEGILDIGRYPSGVDTFAVTMAAAFASGPFVSEARPDIMRSKYAKLITNLANVVAAACPPEDGADRTRIIEMAMAEGEACLRAAGIDFASREEDRRRRADLLRTHPIDGARRPAGSTWQSLARETGDVETDYLNGEIVLLGRLHGVATPVNELLQDLGRRLATERRPPGTVGASDLLARLSDR